MFDIGVEHPRWRGSRAGPCARLMTMTGGNSDGKAVLVTGASGFIGSAVVRALIQQGYRVRALIEPGRSDDNLSGLSVERVAGDIRDPAVLDEAIDEISTVFHL